jgi:hypothetical protein
MAALGSLRPWISTVLPWHSYFVVIASSAATIEASQTWDWLRSRTTWSGSSASRRD